MKEMRSSSADLSQLDTGKKPSDRPSSNVVAFLRRNAFLLFTVTTVALGLGLGFVLRHINMPAKYITYVSFPGELLMRVLQMLVLPLIISSVITGMATLDRKANGKIGLRAFSYYMATTVIAAFTGIGLAVSIQPGNSFRNTSASSGNGVGAVQNVDSFLDLIRNMFPSNLVEACLKKYQTVYTERVSSGMHLGINNTTSELISMPGTADGVNFFGLMVFSLAFGLVLGSMEDKGKPLRDFFESLNVAIMNLVNVVIWYCPVGILFLLAGQVLKMTDVGAIGRDVAMYSLTVFAGLAIHSFFTLPLIYFIVTRKNPYRFMAGVLQALATAFGTSSSSATLPVTLKCMEENHSMNKQVTRFMLPVGATMNMDGGALYEGVAALFIAQLNDMDFNVGQIILLSLVVTAASTGAAGIPQAGMVSMLIVLSSVGLPTEDLSLLMIVDWILDRVRTATNVLGDCIGVGVVQHLSRHELQDAAAAEDNLEERF